MPIDEPFQRSPEPGRAPSFAMDLQATQPKPGAVPGAVLHGVKPHSDDWAGWAIDQIPFAVLTFDSSGQVREANSVARELLPRELLSLPADRWSQWLHATSIAAPMVCHPPAAIGAPRGLGNKLPADSHQLGVDFPISRALRGETVEGSRVQVELPGQGRRYWSIDARAASGRGAGSANERSAGAVVVTIRDVTQVQISDHSALMDAKLTGISEMVTGLAHESRNALQRSQACLDVLSLKVGDRPEARDLIGRIQNAQDHLHQLYEEVREYSAPIRLARQETNLADVVADAWNAMTNLRATKQIALEVKTPPFDLRCQVDPRSIRMVFQHLFENAISAGKGPVGIFVDWRDHPPENSLEIIFADDGPGFASGQQSRIFEPFYTTKTQGTGLGMAVAKRLIEAHGGQISARTSDRGGAEISITLPRKQP